MKKKCCCAQSGPCVCENEWIPGSVCLCDEPEPAPRPWIRWERLLEDLGLRCMSPEPPQHAVYIIDGHCWYFSTSCAALDGSLEPDNKRVEPNAPILTGTGTAPSDCEPCCDTTDDPGCCDTNPCWNRSGANGGVLLEWWLEADYTDEFCCQCTTPGTVILSETKHYSIVGTFLVPNNPPFETRCGTMTKGAPPTSGIDTLSQTFNIGGAVCPTTCTGGLVPSNTVSLNSLIFDTNAGAPRIRATVNASGCSAVNLTAAHCFEAQWDFATSGIGGSCLVGGTTLTDFGQSCNGTLRVRAKHRWPCTDAAVIPPAMMATPGGLMVPSREIVLPTGVRPALGEARSVVRSPQGDCRGCRGRRTRG